MIKENKNNCLLFNNSSPVGKKAIYWPFTDDKELFKRKDGKRVIILSSCSCKNNTAIAYVSRIGNVDISHLEIIPDCMLKDFKEHEYKYDNNFDHEW